VLQGEATATVVVVDSDSVVSVVDLEEDLGEVKAAEVDSDSGEETAAAKAREAPADLDSAARVEVVTAKVEAAMEAAETVQHAALITLFTEKAKGVIKQLDPDNEVTFLRVRSKKHEILIAPDENYILVVLQNPGSSFEKQ